MNNKEEFTNEIISLYDEWIRKEENRGISYGEINYLQNLKSKELKEIYNELLTELERVKAN